eukprot:2949643-Ditylum_brightwellii.AAC.4
MSQPTPIWQYASWQATLFLLSTQMCPTYQNQKQETEQQGISFSKTKRQRLQQWGSVNLVNNHLACGGLCIKSRTCGIVLKHQSGSSPLHYIGGNGTLPITHPANNRQQHSAQTYHRDYDAQTLKGHQHALPLTEVQRSTIPFQHQVEEGWSNKTDYHSNHHPLKYTSSKCTTL